jgi:metal-responsive CopG/Arc/MetJ family transcriptional regulator
MAVQKKEEAKAFTVKFPISLVEEIDQICASNYITRTSWLIRSAKALLEKERMKNTDELLAKLADKEK